MLLLNWTERLKELIGEIESTGGDPIQKLVAPAILIAELKQYLLSQVDRPSKTDIPLTYPTHLATPAGRLSGFFTEQITEGFFDDSVRLCVIELAQFGITESSEVKVLLQKVVHRFVTRIIGFEEDSAGQSKDAKDLLVQHLLEVWENFGSETSRLYDFARQRLLINWDFTNKHWRSTTLGKALLGFSPLQSVCFLLTIDLMNSIGEYDFRYISRDLLESVFRQSPPRHVVPIHLTTLEELGVITRGHPLHWESSETTPIGKLALKRVLSFPNPMVDFIEMLTGAEQEGITLPDSYGEVERVHAILDSPIVDPSTKASIVNAINLYKNKQYTDSVRVLYPSIEAIVNNMLLASGENPHDQGIFPGLTKKLAILEEKGLIRSDLARSLDITTARNKTLHGEFTPGEQEYTLPLCFTAFFYLRRMIEGYNAIRSS